MDPENLYTSLLAENYKPYTIKSYFVLARSFENAVLKSGKFDKWMDNNTVRFKGCYKEKITKISTAQFETYFNKASADTEITMFLYLIGITGLRLSEAFKASWSDIQDNRIHVKEGKGNKQRIVPFKMGKLMESGPMIKNQIKCLKWIKNNCDGFTPHDFRAYAITKWIEQGLHVKQAALLAGHVNTSTTEKYIRTDIKDIEEKLYGNA